VGAADDTFGDKTLPHDSPKILWIGPSARSLRRGWKVESSSDRFDVAVIAAPAPEGTVEELVEKLSRAHTGALVLVYDFAATVADAVRYLRAGAHDVATDEEDVMSTIESVMELQRGQRDADQGSEPWLKLLVGSSAAMLRTVEVIRLVGGRRSTILITGETGTGKEMVARAIHMASPRANLPMVTVNCNALPETLLEAELFGHVKGAFTGAIQQRVGRFEQAHRGTLFLDEIGDLPLDAQTKLLRVLQEREFQRIGSSETIRVDVRLIAATHVDLAERIRQGKFREDLYYRLNVVPIATPPLRQRLEDIPLLAHHFLEKICRQEEIPLRRLAAETLERLGAYSWPGNVRQLENAVERAVALSGVREVLSAYDFPLAIPVKAIAVPETGLDFERTVGGIERQILQQALDKAGGNKTAAAEMLGLKRTTLAAKLKSLEAAASWPGISTSLLY
jgi:DNA-binding NtrC family response regulator